MLDANSPLWQERLEAKLDALTKAVEAIRREQDGANRPPPLKEVVRRDRHGRLIIR